MKNTQLFLIFTLITLFLTGCDSEQARKERCTELTYEHKEAGWGRGERKRPEIKKDQDDLKCTFADIAQTGAAAQTTITAADKLETNINDGKDWSKLR